MTPRQIELARHALGLPNRARRSYRNHFVAGPGHVDYPDWTAMVAAGFAKSHGNAMSSGNYLFWLTRKGAEAALRRGEHLCPVDWPANAP